MNLNNIFKFGSKVSVIISAWKPQEIGGRPLLEGEPFIKIDNVNVNIGYSSNSPSLTRGSENLLQTSKEVPTSLTISGVPLNAKILSLLYSKRDTEDYRTYYERVSCENRTIVLSQSDNKQIFIYNANKDLVLNFSEGDQIITNSLLIEDEYWVFYKHKIETTTYSATSPHISYLTIEIEGIGNENEQTKNIYLGFKKCALVSTAKNTIDFEDIINTIQLNFSIIDGNKPENSILAI